MNDVRVSVIMPIYNEEKYLSYAIDSILAQTYLAWELIIVNDGSTDGSEGVVKRYSDPRIRYFSYDENKGNPYASNLGLSESKGEYLLILAGDDVAYPNMLASQVEYLDNHPECIHVQGAMDYIDENGEITQKNIESKCKSDIEIRAYELYRNCVLGGSSMFRRIAIDEYGLQYDLEAVVSQDYLLWINMLPYGEFACIDEVLFQYRNCYGSNSHRIMDDNREWYDGFMRRIFMHAWKQRGYVLDEADIKFIHDFLFKGKPAWGRHMKQGLCTYNKVVNQSKNLNLKEGTLIIQFYKDFWIEGYKRFWQNRVLGILKEMVRRNR